VLEEYMNRCMTSVVSSAVIVFSLLSSFTAAQTQTKQIPPAPIPTQISTAKRVFVANGGGDDSGISESFFNRDVDRAYNQFYAAMKSAGRYELVGSPAEADLLFEIRFLVQPSDTKVFKGIRLDPPMIPSFAWRFAIQRRTPFCGDSPNTRNGPFCRATGTGISIRLPPAS
jgi:hypothetical protein